MTASPAAPTGRAEALTPTELVDACARLGGRLVTAVHTGTRSRVAALLEHVPEGRLDVLAIALAAMVNPTAQPADLLAWAGAEAPGLPRVALALPREHGSDRGYFQHRSRDEPACPDCLAAHSVQRRSPACRAEFDRLRSVNVNAVTAAELSRATHVLRLPPHRSDPA